VTGALAKFDSIIPALKITSAGAIEMRVKFDG